MSRKFLAIQPLQMVLEWGFYKYLKIKDSYKTHNIEGAHFGEFMMDWNDLKGGIILYYFKLDHVGLRNRGKYIPIVLYPQQPPLEFDHLMGKF